MRWLVQPVKQELAQIAQPALIVHPREDDRASLRKVCFLREKLGGPTQTVVLDDSYWLRRSPIISACHLLRPYIPTTTATMAVIAVTQVAITLMSSPTPVQVMRSSLLSLTLRPPT